MVAALTALLTAQQVGFKEDAKSFLLKNIRSAHLSEKEKSEAITAVLAAAEKAKNEEDFKQAVLTIASLSALRQEIEDAFFKAQQLLREQSPIQAAAVQAVSVSFGDFINKLVEGIKFNVTHTTDHTTGVITIDIGVDKAASADSEAAKLAEDFLSAPAAPAAPVFGPAVVAPSHAPLANNYITRDASAYTPYTIIPFPHFVPRPSRHDIENLLKELREEIRSLKRAFSFGSFSLSLSRSGNSMNYAEYIQGLEEYCQELEMQHIGLPPYEFHQETMHYQELLNKLMRLGFEKKVAREVIDYCQNTLGLSLNDITFEVQLQ